MGDDGQGSGLVWEAQWSSCPLKGEQVSRVERRGSLTGSRTEKEEPGEGGLGDKLEAAKTRGDQAACRPSQPSRFDALGSGERALRRRRRVRTKHHCGFQKPCLPEMSRMKHLLGHHRQPLTRDLGHVLTS